MRASLARAASANQRPQWKDSPGEGGAGRSRSTPTPSAPSRRDSSAASLRRPASVTAAYVPNGRSRSGLTPGSTTRMSGAGRSAIVGRVATCREAMQLAQVHQVVDAYEQEPLPAPQVPDQRMIEREGLGRVAGD